MKKILNKKLLLPLLAAMVLISAGSFTHKNGLFEIAKQIEIFTTLFKELNMNYVDETNPAELMDTAIKNMLQELDPYTTFMNEQDVEAFKINNSGEYSGIGALVRVSRDRLLIVEPYQGYAADKAGLKAGDQIIKIGDTQISDFDDHASELLKGAKNTQVEVTFLRQGETRTATLTREDVEVDAVPFYGMIDAQTGYIVLSRFNEKASSQTKAAMQDLKGQGAQRLILDLRGNPGGLLSEAINVTNLFIPKGELVVTTRSKVKKFNQEYRTRNQPEDIEMPLAVLVDGKSASASEIVSGGLQDLDRAVIIGARSFGKGLVQRPLKLTYGTQLKVTISRYYTPSGRCIQAMDYWNRDDQGHATRNSEFKEFTTRNGRKVQDGGGVIPDVPINSLRTNSLIDALHQNNLIFDFATDYHYGHNIPSLQDFAFSQADYQAFKDFVKSENFNFRTKTEALLEQSLNGDDTLLGPEVQQKYKELLLAVNRGKYDALDTYRGEIQKSLEDEIVTRYFYRKGLYGHYLKKDEAILTARALLADTGKYNSILQ